MGLSPGLTGVPETLLWTLWHRALEARRPDAVLEDPLAVELVGRIDHPFEERFGASAGLAQWQALRMAAFDREIRRFLAANPGATVVALGEGLETQFWRVDDGAVRWVTVDLPESVALRDALLPREPRMTTIAGSALDLAWTDAVDAGRPVLVTAQGLLMYLERADVHGLLAACAERFPGQATLFDTVPRWTSRREMPATPSGYRPPAWRWSVDRAELEALRALPGIAALDLVRLPRGRGAALGLLLPLATRIPALRLALPAVLRARFRGARTAA